MPNFTLTVISFLTGRPLNEKDFTVSEPSSMPRRRFLKTLAAGALAAAGATPSARARAKPMSRAKPVPKADWSWEATIKRHPAADILRRLYPAKPAPSPQGFVPTGLTRADYLPVIAGIVDFFRAYQNEAGAIIDPYTHAERQYSTPAFAAAAARLVRDAGRDDLREPARRALTFSLRALAGHTAADGHADFYIPLVIHARRWLIGDAAHAADEEEWTRLLTSLVPERTYGDVHALGNWNLVNVAGECLRRRDGLVAPDQRAAQLGYIERSLAHQERRLTKFGMYADPNVPLAYDAFPRLWMEDVFADGAYTGAHQARWQEFLTLGGQSTLLLLSPSGEWACGGRSAHHQWNEAEVAVIAEINAVRWRTQGRPDVAGAFKRAAHLALTSMRRWRRPSGELWIVKNRADPVARHGFENYSFHSQYNLLPAAMLAIAYERADDTIPETSLPAETGAYVFDVRDTFHKICACAGGTYALIDTAADPHYNSTGLMRVHRVGVAQSAFSENTAGRRAYGPPSDPISIALSPGLAWNDAPLGEELPEWVSLADFVGKPFASSLLPRTVVSATLTEAPSGPGRVSFTVRYALNGDGARTVEEQYTISAGGVEVASRFVGKSPPAQARLVLPALVSDGAQDVSLSVTTNRATANLASGQTIWEVLAPKNVALALSGPRVPSHNGWMQALTADLPPGTREVRWRVGLKNADT